MISNILIGIIGPIEIILIVVVFVMLFCGKKISELMKRLGKGFHDFKEGLKGNLSQQKDNQSGENKENNGH
jgi:sec-independent protein translocase protein TatA